MLASEDDSGTSTIRAYEPNLSSVALALPRNRGPRVSPRTSQAS
jgi:hypothetical protein